MFKGCSDLTVTVWIICGSPCPFLHFYPSKVHSWICSKRNWKRKMGREEKESKILPSKVQSCRFWKECLKGKWYEEEEISVLTIQSSALQVFEGTVWKEHGMRKGGIQVRPSKSDSPQCCATTASQNYRITSRAMTSLIFPTSIDFCDLLFLYD